MKILTHKQSAKTAAKLNISLDASCYVLVEEEGKWYEVSKDIIKLNLANMRIKRIGLPIPLSSRTPS